MNINEDLTKILEYGCKAPSGSNSQPWKFKVKENIVEVIALPEKDHPVLNFKNRGTYIAHGALIENIEIAAKHFGYEPLIEIFPYKDNLNITAKIIFNKSPLSEQELFEAISKRCSNRKPYYEEQINQDQIEFLLKETNKYPEIELKAITEKDKIKKLSKFLANDMVIYLNNQRLHNLLFKEIIWDEKDFEKEGLFVKTLEIKGPQLSIFKLLKNWKVNKFFLKMGIDKKIAEENSKTFSTSPLLVSFVLNKDKEQDFINLGRIIENVWLRATKLGLSVHIITGILFLWQQLVYGNKDIFSEKEKSIILNSYNSIVEILESRNNQLIIAFLRIGKSEPPSAYSFKKKPIIIEDV